MNEKSPRIDGLPCEFFKAMWDMIVDDLCRMAKQCFSSGSMTKSMNQGLIKSILKNAIRESIRG
jgi:hypothetical protein